MFANVSFLSKPEPSLVLPAQAILQRRDYNYVYVRTKPHTFAKRKVITGETHGQKVMIMDGLKPGEEVITHNAVLLP